MIRPTVGRVVWFYKWAGTRHKGPLAAHVAFVHSDKVLNLMVIDENGVPRSEASVLLVQENEENPQADYACWMPYQKQVASGQIPPTFHADQPPTDPK